MYNLAQRNAFFSEVMKVDLAPFGIKLFIYKKKKRLDAHVYQHDSLDRYHVINHVFWSFSKMSVYDYWRHAFNIWVYHCKNAIKMSEFDLNNQISQLNEIAKIFIQVCKFVNHNNFRM